MLDSWPLGAQETATGPGICYQESLKLPVCMFEAFIAIFLHFCHSSIMIIVVKEPLFVLSYHWLPMATIDLVGDNREFEV